MNTETVEEKKKGPGRPQYEPNEVDRKIVEALTLSGVPQEQTAKMIGITKKTLTKHYRSEVTETTIKRNAQVVGSLYQSAINGNVTSGIFIAKTQLGWKETNVVENKGTGVVVVQKPMTEAEWLKEYGGKAANGGAGEGSPTPEH